MLNKLNMLKALGALCLAVTGAQAARADTWTVVPDESEIRFVGTQTGSMFEGTFKDFSVQVTYDAANPQNARVHASIDTGSAKTGDTQRDEALPGKDWFFASMFPTAIFETEGFKKTGPDNFTTNGSLEIKGVKQELALPFTLTIEGDRATMTSELSLNRQDYNVGAGPWAEGKWVGLDVKVMITIVAERDKS